MGIYFKVFYVMGKVLTGELSCFYDRSCFRTNAKMKLIEFLPLKANFSSPLVFMSIFQKANFSSPLVFISIFQTVLNYDLMLVQMPHGQSEDYNMYITLSPDHVQILKNFVRVGDQRHIHDVNEILVGMVNRVISSRQGRIEKAIEWLENKIGVSLHRVLQVPYFSAYKTEAFPFQSNPKNLDPSYKTDLEF